MSIECSAAKKVPFVPFDGATLTYHTNHPLSNDDYSAWYVERLTKLGALPSKVSTTARVWRCSRICLVTARRR